MDKKKAISILVALALVAIAVTGFIMWPKKYTVGQHMAQAVVFWNDHDAFLFLTVNTTGRSRNILQEKLEGTRYSYLTLLAGGFSNFNKQDVVAYDLAVSGQLDRFPLPENTATYGSWGLIDGQLQLTPPSSTTRALTGTRWDGEKFVTVAPLHKAPAQAQPQPQANTDSTLKADDLTDDANNGDDDDGFLTKAARQEFKDAGWHYKVLSGYESNGAEATLPIKLGENTFNLGIQAFPPKTGGGHFDFLTYGARTIQLSGDKLASGPQTIWNQQGWQPITREDFERLQARYGHAFNRRQTASSLIWLVALLFLVFWRFGSWIHLLFSFATMKQKVLKNMATAFSFPPATPAQFPFLDLEALGRYTRAFEGMGFTKLLDFSLVSDSPNLPPSFCRLMVHTRYHCFGELSQIFPKRQKPFPFKCSIQSCLQNGWTLSFSDRKPQAASSLIRRRKAMGICMPDANPPELLQALIKMRDQVCLDLGIQALNDDTLEAYIAKTQRSATEMREAVQNKSFVKGVPEVYLRKLSLIQSKPEYVWLGDYPKEAEQRKQGFNTFAAGAR
ncbi:MAG TPA: hypothetical protein VMR80_00680 [Candidatus Acidoferrum sp.]|nr:hypothetical protein [Candidatus Acidoferrum sp.]